MVKHEPDRLRPRFCSAPALRLSRSKSRLDGIIFILRGDLHHGRPLDIEPAFTARPNRLWSWGNKPLTHMSSLTLARLGNCELGLGCARGVLYLLSEHHLTTI